MAKDINNLKKLAKELGFTITQTAKGHYKFEGYGSIFYTAGTSSDRRTVTHLKKNLTKAAQDLQIARP